MVFTQNSIGKTTISLYKNCKQCIWRSANVNYKDPNDIARINKEKEETDKPKIGSHCQINSVFTKNADKTRVIS